MSEKELGSNLAKAITFLQYKIPHITVVYQLSVADYWTCPHCLREQFMICGLKMVQWNYVNTLRALPANEAVRLRGVSTMHCALLIEFATIKEL